MSESKRERIEDVLQDRHILVVGASSGIGRATAAWLGERGARVAAVGRRGKLLEELVAEISGGVAIEADLRDPDQCQALVDKAVAALGKFDALVFAASASTLAMTADAGADVWRSVMETNVIAPALVTRSLLPHLTPAAFLGYLSSEVVGQPYHGLAHYASSKSALEELVRALRVEHPSYRFCCIRVGATMDTEFARDFSPELAAELSRHWIARAKIPENLMISADLGRAIGGAVAIALATPGVDLQDLTLRPPGGPFSGELPNVAEQIAELKGG
jgi:NAD(P)-dependent dehydrogenase (short-subunit alcohol dehydrogenase family)